jgi:hypothetical protein
VTRKSVLLFVGLAIALVAAGILGHWWTYRQVLSLWMYAPALFGVVTVTYKYPVSGLVAPTAQQVRALSMVTAVLNWGDTDTSATITHNFGLSSAELADLFPAPLVYAIALNGSPSAPAPFVNLTDGNTITITKSSVTNSGGTFNVVIFRPHTDIR